MSNQEIAQFLRHNPRYREILERAIEAEEGNVNNPNWLGWKWDDVRAHGAQLVKLVVAGVIKVAFKSNASNTYLLVDREATSKAIVSVNERKLSYEEKLVRLRLEKGLYVPQHILKQMGEE